MIMCGLRKDIKEVDNMKSETRWFKCPACGGNIKRLVKKDNCNYIVVPGTPICEECGIEWVVRINEDLSYDIENIFLKEVDNGVKEFFNK